MTVSTVGVFVKTADGLIPAATVPAPPETDGSLSIKLDGPLAKAEVAATAAEEITDRVHINASDYIALGLGVAIGATPSGMTLDVTGDWTIPPTGLQFANPITVEFRGVVNLTQAVSGGLGLVVTASNVMFVGDLGKVKVTGPQATATASRTGTYNDPEIGLDVHGPSAASPITGFRCKGMQFNNWSRAIKTKYLDGFTFERVEANHCQYIGFHNNAGSSNGDVIDCVVRDIGPGTSFNAYGFTADRPSTTDLVTDPAPKNIRYIRCKAQDIPVWHGFDTHGGDSIQWIDCEVLNTLRALNVGGSVSGSTSVVAAKNFYIRNFKGDSGVTDGSRSGGVIIIGLTDPASGSVSAVTGRAEGIYLKGYGNSAVTDSGAVIVQGSECVSLNHVRLDEPSRNGINAYYFNKCLRINGLTVTDVWAPAGGVSAGIVVGLAIGHNDILVSGYRGQRGARVAGTNVINSRGISVGSLITNTAVTLGTDIDVSAYATPISAADGTTRRAHGTAWTTQVTGLPQRGVWPAGSQFWKAAPAAGASPGWIVTTAGGLHAGTWAAMTAYTLGTWRITSTNKVLEALFNQAPVTLMDFPSVAASGGTQSLTVTVPGALVGHAVTLAGTTGITSTGLTIAASVTAPNTVTVTVTNPTGAPIDPPATSVTTTVSSSGTVEPNPAAIGDTVVDGTITWIYRAASAAVTGPMPGYLTGSASLDFPSIAAAGQADLTISVPGAALNDPVAVGYSASIETGLVPFAFVSAVDTVTVRMANITAAAINPASRTYKVTVTK